MPADWSASVSLAVVTRYLSSAASETLALQSAGALQKLRVPNRNDSGPTYMLGQVLGSLMEFPVSEACSYRPCRSSRRCNSYLYRTEPRPDLPARLAQTHPR